MKDTVAIEPCTTYTQVADALPRLLKALGVTLPKGKTVLVKPNILTAVSQERNVTTHPSLVGAVCRQLASRDNRVIVGESSGMMTGGGTRTAFERSGIAKAAKDAGAEVIVFEGQPLVTKKTGGTRLKEITLPKMLFDADLIISLPKLKTHMLTRYTGAVKNLYGCIPGGKKGELHGRFPGPDEFSEMVVDLYQAVPPQLCIMDAVVGMEGMGPAAGESRKVEKLIASRNGAALDVVASRMIGFGEDEVPTVRITKERGLVGEVSVVGEESYQRFKRPVQWSKYVPKGLLTMLKPVMGLAMLKPYIHDNCTLCDACRKTCPAKVIAKGETRMHIDHAGCILCYCCHEVCPHDAINLARTRLTADMIHKGKKD